MRSYKESFFRFINGRKNWSNTVLISWRKSIPCWQCIWNSSIKIIWRTLRSLQARSRNSLCSASFWGGTMRNTVVVVFRGTCFRSSRRLESCSHVLTSLSKWIALTWPSGKSKSGARDKSDPPNTCTCNSHYMSFATSHVIHLHTHRFLEILAIIDNRLYMVRRRIRGLGPARWVRIVTWWWSGSKGWCGGWPLQEADGLVRMKRWTLVFGVLPWLFSGEKNANLVFIGWILYAWAWRLLESALSSFFWVLPLFPKIASNLQLVWVAWWGVSEYTLRIYN